MVLEHTPTSFSLQEKGCPRKELGVFQPNIEHLYYIIRVNSPQQANALCNARLVHQA